MKMWTLIETAKAHKEALARVDALFDKQPTTGSLEDKELKLLIHLVEQYEEEHFPIGNPDPIDAVKIRMQDLRLSANDLIPSIGDKGTVSKVLNRQRPLSLEMIRKLEEQLNIPASVLIQRSRLKPKRAQQKTRRKTAA